MVLWLLDNFPALILVLSFIMPLYVTAKNIGGFDHRKTNRFKELGNLQPSRFQRLTGQMGRDRLRSQVLPTR